MKPNLFKVILSIILSLFYLKYNSYSQTNSCQVDYEEIDNIVVIEAENIDTSLWSVETATSGFSGTGYLEYGNGNNFNSPGNGLISVEIKINDTGVYRFQWRSKVGEGTSSTDENDTWLRFPDATDFYGQKTGSTIYPAGIGKTPTPNGSSSDGWFKVYSSGTTNWTWSTNTSDNDPHQIYVQFDSPGVYTMEISARSQYHFLDRIILYKDISTANATNLNLPETSCSNSLSTTDISYIKNNVKVFPNPVNSSNNIHISGIPQDIYDVQIIDLSGKILNKETLTIKSDFEEFQIENLKSGFYFLTLTNRSNTPFSTKFIVK